MIHLLLFVKLSRCVWHHHTANVVHEILHSEANLAAAQHE